MTLATSTRINVSKMDGEFRARVPQPTDDGPCPHNLALQASHCNLPMKVPSRQCGQGVPESDSAPPPDMLKWTR